MPTRSFASRFESGSSSRNACGSRTIARPIATRCRWPPESCAGRRSSRSVEAEELGDLVDAARDLGLRGAARLQAVAEVLAHGHVRVERVGLEDHGDVAAARREVGHVAVADRDRAVRDLLEPGDHPQQRRLAAARRADEHEELAVARSRARRRRRPSPRRTSCVTCSSADRRHAVDGIDQRGDTSASARNLATGIDQSG